ncbi:MAG: septum formation protein Maf [candidate division WOR-3 bacterium]|nr:MAG: septum formation protein Maf [candidate division WOR-3 bacterium]
MDNAKKIILASRSPRRLRLLATIVPEDRIVVMESNIEEIVEPNEDAENYCTRIAKNKAQAVWKKYEGEVDEIAAVIGADTVISFESNIIGQPEDAAHAVQILRKLSGNCHEVVTGVAVFVPSRTHFTTFAVRSKVWMRRVVEEMIKSYVATGEPMDKAGAYAIQGRGRFLVERYEGSRSNIIGLPIKELEKVLKDVVL